MCRRPAPICAGTRHRRRTHCSRSPYRAQTPSTAATAATLAPRNTPQDTLKAEAAARGASFSLACHFIALRLANLHEAFRLRLEGGRVRIFEAVHGSTTVLRDDESFGFATLQHTADFAAFCSQGSAAMAAVRTRQRPFEPDIDEAALVHFTTLPWLHFTSFSHARNWGRDDAVPKVSFGRADTDGCRLWLPLSVEVHHALMDGVHVGRYVQAFEAALAEPARWLA